MLRNRMVLISQNINWSEGVVRMTDSKLKSIKGSTWNDTIRLDVLTKGPSGINS